MEKSIKVCIILTIFGISLIILIATFIKINDESDQSKFTYLTNNYISIAKHCIESKACNENNISLKELKEKELIIDTINPLTNEEFNLSSFISYPEYKFYIVTEIIN